MRIASPLLLAASLLAQSATQQGTQLGSPAAPDLRAQVDHLIGKGKFRAAIELLDGALARTPDDAALLVLRAYSRTRAGDAAGSIRDATRAVELDPKNFRAFVERGYARSERGDVAGAIGDYDRAVELEPKCATAFADRGDLRRRRGELALAQQDLTRAIELQADFGTALRRRGDVRQALGDFAGALDDYDRFLLLSPGAVDVLMTAADMAFFAGRHEPARRYAELAVAATKGEPSTQLHRGVLALDAGELVTALDALQRAVASSEGRLRAQAQLLLGWAQLAAGRDADVLAATRTLLAAADGPRARALLLRWCAQARAEKPADACAELAGALASVAPAERPLLQFAASGAGGRGEVRAAAEDTCSWLFAEAWRARNEARGDAARTALVRAVDTGEVGNPLWAVAALLLQQPGAGPLPVGLGVTLAPGTDGSIAVGALARECTARAQGLEVGDRIVSIGGAPVTATSWHDATSGMRPGQTVMLRIVRAGVERTQACTAGFVVE
jgi:tetratricopeptide (TPR) repeat protein